MEIKKVKNVTYVRNLAFKANIENMIKKFSFKCITKLSQTINFYKQKIKFIKLEISLKFKSFFRSNIINKK